jgi:signal transduction histidine kinase
MDILPFATLGLAVMLVVTAGCVSPGSGEKAVNTSPPVTTQPVQARFTSEDELVSFVQEAVVYTQKVGKVAALKEFADKNGSFTRGEVYTWAYDFNGTNLAHPYHPEYLGQNKLDLSDASGVRMIEEMRDTARNGSGFVAYQYENPVTGVTEPKLSYVKRVDDTWWIGSGIYGKDLKIPQQAPEMVQEVLRAKVAYAAQFAREVGEEAALVAFNNASGLFVTKDTYIFAFDANGTTLAMPFVKENIGKNERNLTDINGVSIGERKIHVAGQGGGFFYYVYTNPATGRPGFKVSYVEPVDSRLVVGTGIYLPPDVPAGFDKARIAKMVARVGDAAAFAKENGREAAILKFNNRNSTFEDPEMFVFAFDANGTLLANPYLPGLVGMNRLADRDPYGEYPVPYMIENAKQGGGFMYYFFADPSSDYRVRLKLAYTQMAGDDLVVGAGIFP